MTQRLRAGPARIVRVFGAGVAFGGLLAFFLDPKQGKRRRQLVRDRPRGFVNRARRRGARLGRAISSEVYGATKKVTHLREKPKDYDDITLARKVETEIFRDADVPKGQINVNVERGVVYLRGEAPRPELIDDLIGRARKVQGVVEVESLLHLPQTQAPMKNW